VHHFRPHFQPFHEKKKRTKEADDSASPPPQINARAKLAALLQSLTCPGDYAGHSRLFSGLPLPVLSFAKEKAAAEVAAEGAGADEKDDLTKKRARGGGGGGSIQTLRLPLLKKDAQYQALVEASLLRFARTRPPHRRPSFTCSSGSPTKTTTTPTHKLARTHLLAYKSQRPPSYSPPPYTHTRRHRAPRASAKATKPS
jgi:hypothetical protein